MCSAIMVCEMQQEMISDGSPHADSFNYLQKKNSGICFYLKTVVIGKYMLQLYTMVILFAFE